jgi:ligand-binding sensor domain-containing protein
MFKSILLLSLSIAFGSCGQFKSFSEKTEPIHAGLVYFSKNDGLDWENVGAGLPDSLSIGLGGIAVSENLLGIATKEKGVYLFDEKASKWDNLPTNEQILKDQVGPLFFYSNHIFLGTQYGGVYFTNDLGKSWSLRNEGLSDKTIRRFVEINGVLYAATNDGLYSFDNPQQKWDKVYGQAGLQVNGVTEFKGDLYLATNRGVYKSNKNAKDGSLILPNHSVHNIAADKSTLYAMTYTSLLIATVDGITWKSCQAGLPDNLYTFNMIKKGDNLFAGQWDGVYKKADTMASWKSTSRGLPTKFAATNLKVFKDILVVSMAKSERK